LVEVLEERDVPTFFFFADGGTPQSATVGQAYSEVLGVSAETIVRGNDTPVSGLAVTFSAPTSGPGGSFSATSTVSTETVYTDVNGSAAVTLYANTSPGSFTVDARASFGGSSHAVHFSLTNLAGAPAHIVAVGGTPQSATVGTAYTTALQTQVTDQYANPVPGVAVTFAVPGSGAAGTFAGGPTVTTDASGQATAGTLTANTVAGPFTVTASVSGLGTAADFSLTNTAGAAAAVTAVAGTPQSATVGTAYATALQARVADAFGNPIGGVSITFTAPTSGPGGSFSGSPTVTVTTAANGQATAGTLTANTVAGPFAVTATVSGLSTPARFTLSNTAGNAAHVAAVAGAPQSARVGTAFATPLQVRVTDASGNPVRGAAATFAAPASGPGGSFAGNATVLTDASGLATAPTLTAGTVAGNYAVTASVAGAGSVSFSLANTAGTPADITAIAGTPQSAAVGTAYAVPLQARVTDAFGNPVPGVSVTFVAPAAGPGGTFASGAAVLTDALGMATAPALTANGSAGSYTVTATVGGVSTPALFGLTNLPGSGVPTGPLPSSAALSVARAGRAVWLTASVDGAGEAGEPATGSVEFFDTFHGKRRLVAIATVSGGVARRRMVLRRGMHALQAVYLGDARYSGSSSTVRLRRVVQN
jgi:hypothetical protein